MEPLHEQRPQENLPTVDDLEVYRIVFELFDRSQIGMIRIHELASIAIKLGYDPEQGKFLIRLTAFSFSKYWEHRR